MNENDLKKCEQQAIDALRKRENKEMAINKMMELELSRNDAEALINRMMSEIKNKNKAFGVKALIAGCIGLLITAMIVLYFDRLYYWVMGVSLLAVLAGICDIIWPSPYKIRTSIGEEKTDF